MKLIINNSSMQPIYEQIVSQIKAEIMKGALKEDTALPSVRALARELKVSALTVEERRKEVESDLEQAIRKGRSCGMSNREITEVFQIILEDQG